MLRKLSVSLLVAVCLCGGAACTSEVRGTPSEAAPGGSSAVPSSGPSSDSGGSGDSGSGGNGGSGGSGGGSGSDSGGSDQVLQKFRLVDPCSFVQKSAFAALGQNPQFTNGGLSGYDDCYATLTLKQKGKPAAYSISAQFSDGSTPAEVGPPLSARLQQKTINGSTVLSGTSSTFGCIDALVLGDRLSLVMAARTSGKTDACAISTAMATGAITSVKQGSYQQLQGAQNTPAAIDFCAELGDAAKTLLAGSTTVKPGLHGCTWTAGTNSVIVTLRSDSWPPGFPGPGSKPQTVGGHPALVGGTAQNGRILSISEIRLSPSQVTNGDYNQVDVVAGLGGSGSEPQNRIQAFLSAAAGVH